MLEPQFLILVRNISYENKSWKTILVRGVVPPGLLAGVEKQDCSPEECPARLDKPRSIAPRCKQSRAAACAVTERRGIREMYNVPLCAISFHKFPFLKIIPIM